MLCFTTSPNVVTICSDFMFSFMLKICVISKTMYSCVTSFVSSLPDIFISTHKLILRYPVPCFVKDAGCSLMHTFDIFTLTHHAPTSLVDQVCHPSNRTFCKVCIKKSRKDGIGINQCDWLWLLPTQPGGLCPVLFCSFSSTIILQGVQFVKMSQKYF